MRTLALTLLLTCAWATAGADAQSPQPKPADRAPAKTEKGDKNEPVPGRKTKKIEGFTFLISEEALSADGSKYERPPLDCLEYECKLLTKTLSPSAVKVLRRLTVFVNWDESVPLSNGRAGVATATYFGGPPQQAVREGRHPMQAKTVTIHTLKALTQSRQPSNDARGGCLLLHEFAHAVHDQLLTYNHPGIKAAYEQAMERRLYEKEFYASTNTGEFFAEMTCAYLDRLSYFPHNRDELKKHDPVTFKTMEAVWAGAAGNREGQAPSPHAEKRDTGVALPADVKFGPALTGPALGADLKGKVVLVGFWGGLHTNVLSRLDRLQGELGDYGLVVVCPQTYVRDDAEVKSEAEKRSSRVTVLKNAFVRSDRGEFLSQPAGHAVLFDATGKCVYRGSAYAVDEPARAAVGKALLAAALGDGEVPKAFKPAADAFAAGAAPVAAVPKVAPLLTSPDEDTKTKAKRLADLILAPGQKALAAAQGRAKTDPVAAFLEAEAVAATFKGTPVGTRAASLVSNLRTTKPVATELRARSKAADIDKVITKLRGQEGSFDPSSSDFQNRHKLTLAQLKALLDQLRKQYPDARATAEAAKAALEFGVS